MKNPDHFICSSITTGQLKEAEHWDLDAIANDRILEIDKNKLERQGPRLAEGLRNCGIPASDALNNTYAV